MPSTPDAIVASYAHAISHHHGPVIMFEHRLMYDLSFDANKRPNVVDPFDSRVVRSGIDVTIVATSIMVLEALRAATYLAEYGVECEVIDLHNISHPNREVIMGSLRKTGKLVVADTSWLAYGVAAEVCRIVAETDPKVLKSPVVSLGMAPSPCPTAKALEDIYYPDLHRTIDSIAYLVLGKRNHGITNIEIDSMYQLGMKEGALGGKLLGAGGGGFMLFFVRPEQQERMREMLRNFLYVPFRFDLLGSQIIYYSHEDEY